MIDVKAAQNMTNEEQWLYINLQYFLEQKWVLKYVKDHAVI